MGGGGNEAEFENWNVMGDQDYFLINEIHARDTILYFRCNYKRYILDEALRPCLSN